MKNYFFGCMIAVALILSGDASVRSQPSHAYTIIPLPKSADNFYGPPSLTMPRGINDSGQVVGSVSFAGQEEDPRAFLWQNGGAIRDLGTLTLGGSYSSAEALNVSGQVVGSAWTTGDTGYRAVLWENNAVRDLGTLGGTISHATAINASGQIVGFSDKSGDFPFHAFVWQDGVGMRDLGTLGGPDSRANGINASGQVVGYSITARSAARAFLWKDGVGMRDLETLGGGGYSSATAINASGQVVGDSSAIGGDGIHGFLWQEGLGMRDLGTLGGNYSSASAINASGQVVGSAGTSGSEPRAFLWQDGAMRDLNTLVPPDSGWVLHGASAINDAGQIVGWGYFNNELRGFLLNPVVTPTPGADDPLAVPGRIDAENYDRGGAGVSYVDSTSGNSGGSYRSDDVDLEPVSGSTTNFNVGWMMAGEWLQYTIDVGAAGTYTVDAQVASYGSGGTFHLEVNGVKSGSIDVPDTGGWQQWQTVTTTLTLAAGVQQLRVVLDTNGSSGGVGNLDYFRLSSGADPGPAPLGFTVEADSFAGGARGCWPGPFLCGGGYYDETPGNWGDAQVRPGTDVDLWYDDGGIVIGGLDGLEWVTFPVNVPQTGNYAVRFRTASPSDRPAGSGVINVGTYGIDASWVGNQPVPVSGGPGEWHSYVSWNASTTIYLRAGQQTLTLWASGGWYNVRNMTFTPVR